MGNDPFTGTWKFNARKSTLTDPTPRRWIQTIVATEEQLVVREEIVRANGAASEVKIWARFDGADYPVLGSPLADFIAYERVERNSISGTGKKNGVITFTETITVSPDGKLLTLVYSLQTGASQVARGVAVFERQAVAIQEMS